MNIYAVAYRRPADMRNQFKRVHAVDEDAAQERVGGMFPDAQIMHVRLVGRTRATARRRSGAPSAASVERAMRAAEAAANW